MSLFGTYIQEATRSFEEDTNFDTYTMEEASEPSLEEVMEVFSDIVFENDEEAVEEGANLEITAKFREAKAAYKEQAKILKKQIKAKEFGEAQKTVTNMENILTKAEKDIRAIDAGGAGSVILGYFAGLIMNWAELLVPSLGVNVGTGVATAAGAAGKAGVAAAGAAGAAIFGAIGYVKSLFIFIKQIKTFIGELDNADTSTAEAFNKYRSTIIRYLGDLKKNLANIKKGLAKAEAKAAAK